MWQKLQSISRKKCKVRKRILNFATHKYSSWVFCAQYWAKVKLPFCYFQFNTFDVIYLQADEIITLMWPYYSVNPYHHFGINFFLVMYSLFNTSGPSYQPVLQQKIKIGIHRGDNLKDVLPRNLHDTHGRTKRPVGDDRDSSNITSKSMIGLLENT